MPNLLWLAATPLILGLLLLAFAFLSCFCSKSFSLRCDSSSCRGDSHDLKQSSQRGLFFTAFLFSLWPLAFLIYHNDRLIGTTFFRPWMPALNINFFLYLDALSLVFVALTAIIAPLSLFAKPKHLLRPHFFYSLVLLTQGLLLIFFMAADLALFNIFWEAILIPLYLMVVFYGSPHRMQVALKFILYMLAGSIFMVAGVLALYFTSGVVAGERSFEMALLAKVAPYSAHLPLIAAAFFLAFAVKTPLFPFHAWLPDLYQQSPMTGTILLSALLSKAGIYGFLRIGLGILNPIMPLFAPLLLGLAIAGVIYGGLAAYRQQDMKRLLAYSSFSHVNFALIGIFVFSEQAHIGAIIQALNHAVTITALFFVLQWLIDRLQDSSIDQAGGVAKTWPMLSWLTLFFVLSSVALPGMNNFVGELLILFGLFGYHPVMALVAGSTVILSVVYMLRWMQMVYFGPSFGIDGSKMRDIGIREGLIALPLIFFVLLIGLYPSPFLEKLSSPSQQQASLASAEETQ